MMKPIRDFCWFFALQFVTYAVFCWNARAVAQAWYTSMFVSDMLFAGINFTVIKKVAEAKSRASQAGYVLGGACGSLVSVWLTQRVYGK